MILNNLAFLAVWYFWIEKFGSISGWGFSEVLLLLGSLSLVYGIITFLFGGIARFDKLIRGDMDVYLLRPRSIFLQYASDWFSFASTGDIIFGVFLLALSGYGAWEVLFVFSISFLIFLSFFTLLSALVLLTNTASEKIFEDVSDIFLGAGIWPVHTIKHEFLRLFLFFVIPGFLLGAGQIEALLTIDFEKFLLLISVLFFHIVLASFLWKLALRKYTGLAGIGFLKD